jgi:FAD/FMN-containing dehydrogenase
MNRHELVCYNIDASRIIGNAQGVFFPENIGEVQAIVKNSEFDIVPRGAGTSIEGGCVPRNSVIVDLCRMNKILDFNFSKKQVRVEAGITIRELNEKLKKANLEFPIYSYDSEISAIGGAIALNLVGDRSMKYGNIRDWVEEIQIINGKGEIIKTSKADLMDVCGMEGITGIIISATLRVLPLINRTASIFQTESLDELLMIGRKAKAEKEVSMLRFLSGKVSKLLDFPEKYHLIVEFSSDRGRINKKDYDELLKKINNSNKLLFYEGYCNIEDSKLFFDKLRDFIRFLEINNIPCLGDFGTGVIYAFFKDEEKVKKREFRIFMKKARAKPGKYGIGLNRKELLDSFEAKLLQRVKIRYDPKLKFNINKVIDIESLFSSREKEEIKTGKDAEKKIGVSSSSKGNLTPAKDEHSSEQEFPKEAQKPAKSFDYSIIKNIMTNQYKGDNSDKVANNNGNKTDENKHEPGN